MNTPKRQTLNSISARSVKDFLLQQRFKPIERWGDFLEVYALATDHSQTVVAPVDDRIADYDNRLSMLLMDLSRLFEQSVPNIINEIVNSGYEPLRIVANEGEGQNTLAYDAAIDLLRHAFRLIDCSAVVELADHPVRIVQGRRKDIVRDYLDNIRVGQSEVGSYVLTLLMPRRATTLSAEWADSENNPFGAKLARRLDRSLSTAKAAITTGDADVQSLANDGLTANFVASLAKMVDAVPTVGIGVRAEQPSANMNRNLHRFRSSDRVSLLQVSNSLSPPEKRSPITLRGTITQISEPKRRVSGQIVIETEIYGETKPVRVTYDREHRQIVLDAIGQKADVVLEVDGTLVEKRGQYSLEDPHGFRLSFQRLLT